MKSATGAGGVALLLALMLLPALPAGSAPIHIGSAAAVKNQVQGIVDGQQQFLYTGGGVFHDEIIRTNAKSMAQLLLLDSTSLGIGPNSEIKLDKFVFDPASKNGNVVLEASRGAFRFITGTQDPRNYTIKTPVATIGVRGTIIHFQISPDNQLTFYLEKGQAILTLNNGQVLNLANIGQGVEISSSGTVTNTQSNAPSDPLNVGWPGFYFASLHTDLKSSLGGGKSEQDQIDALANSIVNAVIAYGEEFTASIVSLAIAEAQQMGMSDEAIGKALAEAAKLLAALHRHAAEILAQTLANEGTQTMIDAFVDALGPDYAWLADIARGNPEATQELPGPNNFDHTFDQPAPSCLNPSCN